MAQEFHPDAHHAQPRLENVCLTGATVMAALLIGLAITTILFVWAFKMH